MPNIYRQVHFEVEYPEMESDDQDSILDPELADEIKIQFNNKHARQSRVARRRLVPIFIPINNAHPLRYVHHAQSPLPPPPGPKSYAVFINPANQVLAGFLPPLAGFRASGTPAGLLRNMNSHMVTPLVEMACRWREIPSDDEDVDDPSEIALSLNRGILTTDPSCYRDYEYDLKIAPVVGIHSTFKVPVDVVAATTGPNAERWQPQLEEQVRKNVLLSYDEIKGLCINIRRSGDDSRDKLHYLNQRVEEVDRTAMYTTTSVPIANWCYTYMVLYPGVIIFVHDPTPEGGNGEGSTTRRVRIRALPPKSWFTAIGSYHTALIECVGRDHFDACRDAAVEDYDTGADWVDLDEALF